MHEVRLAALDYASPHSRADGDPALSHTVMLEKALAKVGNRMGVSSRPNSTSAEARLRGFGKLGAFLVSRLSRLSKARNCAAHPDIPDIAFLDDIASLSTSGSSSGWSEDGACIGGVQVRDATVFDIFDIFDIFDTCSSVGVQASLASDEHGVQTDVDVVAKIAFYKAKIDGLMVQDCPSGIDIGVQVDVESDVNEPVAIHFIKFLRSFKQPRDVNVTIDSQLFAWKPKELFACGKRMLASGQQVVGTDMNERCTEERIVEAAGDSRGEPVIASGGSAGDAVEIDANSGAF